MHFWFRVLVLLLFIWYRGDILGFGFFTFHTVFVYNKYLPIQTINTGQYYHQFVWLVCDLLHWRVCAPSMFSMALNCAYYCAPSDRARRYNQRRRLSEYLHEILFIN